MKSMQVISSFEYSTTLEIAINRLEEQGISKEDIVAIPLENIVQQSKVLDSIDQSDGLSLLDLAAVLATAFSVLGASYGFSLKWGPIIWGLIGFAFGAILGFIIDLLLTKKKINEKKTMNTEVILIIKCREHQFQMIRNILSENFAFGIGKLVD